MRFQVSLVDYGPTITTDSSNVRALTNRLAAYPIQAFGAYLQNVEPLRNSWDTECTNKFVEMVSEAFLYARIKELKVRLNENLAPILCFFICILCCFIFFQAGPMLGIELIDTNNEEDVVINQKLVVLGLAKGR